MTPIQDRMAAIARCARRADTDETLGDARERIETVLWYATGGIEGKDWGHGYPQDGS